MRTLRILLLLPLRSFGQPPVLGTGTMPYPGFQHGWTSAGNFIDLPDQGPGAVWDFSALTAANTSVRQWDTVTFNQQEFPLATLQIVGGNTWWSVSGDSLHYCGHQALLNLESYTDPRLELRLPLNYGDSWTDVYEGGSIVSPSISGTMQVEVTGYGTLLLPTDTLSDVLRVDIVDVNVGTNNGLPTETYIDTLVRFYTPGFPWYLLEVQKRQTIHDFGTYASTSVHYVSEDISTGALGGRTMHGALRAFPNPRAIVCGSVVRAAPGPRPSVSPTSWGRTVRSWVSGSTFSRSDIEVDVSGLPR
ncbi:MAG: hypothetical protein IPO87_04580 [Flavobacteriales bacterium]|nr:hypothetical protein [Flavobacteriales bacterium]